MENLNFLFYLLFLLHLIIAAGKLPKHNNVSWRGNSCTHDGKSDSSSLFKDLSGGFYDAGDAIKFNFPASFSMTMLSWSVIEYSAKYEAAGELNHVKEIIKWGSDYFLKTFNHTADSIDRIVAQVLQSFVCTFILMTIKSIYASVFGTLILCCLIIRLQQL